MKSIEEYKSEIGKLLDELQMEHGCRISHVEVNTKFTFDENGMLSSQYHVSINM